MDRKLSKARSKTVRLAGSHIITTCATLAALLLFVALGSQVLPAAVMSMPLPGSGSTLKVAFLLNIAIILFGWRRSRDLKEALEASDEVRRSRIDHAVLLFIRLTRLDVGFAPSLSRPSNPDCLRANPRLSPLRARSIR